MSVTGDVEVSDYSGCVRYQREHTVPRLHRQLSSSPWMLRVCPNNGHFTILLTVSVGSNMDSGAPSLVVASGATSGLNINLCVPLVGPH